jgi:two-component system, response regulator YesN
MKLLIVDDERNIRTFMKNVLTKLDLGLSLIEIAQDGTEGLDKAREIIPDIVITDIVMPGRTGHELISEMQKINPLCIYIMISGHDDVAYFKEAISLQVFWYILKPINIDELTSVLKSAIIEGKKRKSNYFDEIFTNLFRSIDNIDYDFSYIKDTFHKTLLHLEEDSEKSLGEVIVKISSLMLALINRENIIHNKSIFEYFNFDELYTSTCISNVIKWCDSSLSKIQSKKITRENHRAETLINLACKFIEENYNKNIGASEIAESCNISPGYLSGLFKHAMDVTIPQYITSVRLKHVLFLLADPIMPISKAAQTCGFNNINYFTKVFKNRFGELPSKYRGVISTDEDI